MQGDGIKNGFVLYSTYYGPVSALTDEQAGRLFKAILAHASGEDAPPLGPAESMAYAFIRAQMEYDDARYAKRAEANRRNGARGGRPKTEKTDENPKNPMGFEETEKTEQEQAPQPVSVQDKTARRKEYSQEFEELWKLYPVKDDKWNGFLKYEARRKKYSHEQLLGAVKAYLAKKQRDRDYPRYVKQLQTFFSSDMADFTQYIGAAVAEKVPEHRDSDEDWAAYFGGDGR